MSQRCCSRPDCTFEWAPESGAGYQHVPASRDDEGNVYDAKGRRLLFVEMSNFFMPALDDPEWEHHAEADRASYYCAHGFFTEEGQKRHQRWHQESKAAGKEACRTCDARELRDARVAFDAWGALRDAKS